MKKYWQTTRMTSLYQQKTMKKLKEKTIQFLKVAEKHNLCFKRSKCDFNIKEILILGVIVGKGQVKMEQDKIKAIKEWKTLTKVKDVKSFLGFANFYQRFIQNFSHTAKLLNKLKGKKKWTWNEEHDKCCRLETLVLVPRLNLIPG